MKTRTPSLLVVLCLVACGSPSAMETDAGIVVPDVSMTLPDAATEPDAAAPRFGRCHVASDCPASSPSCNSTYPGGICTIACLVDADCGEGAVCWGRGCAPTCVLGSNDCAPHGADCYDNPAGPDFCIAACFVGAAPTDWPTCGAGEHCNPWGNYCDPDHVPLPSGGDNGAPCTGQADCKSATCFSGLTYIGGECVSYGREVAPSAFVVGGPLPQSDCPKGSVVMPGDWLSLSVGEGDFVYCFPSCTADSDCRAGYECMGLQDEGDGRVFTVGACSPTDDCMNPAHACPTGHSCVGNTAQAHCE
jgi:hypothetical protein